MSIILKLKAEEILDSRDNPTLSVLCVLQNGIEANASVPSGASTGKHEACELRDGDMERCAGKGMLKAIENINIEISDFLIGKELDQSILDEYLINLDATKNKNRLGANAILAVSMAFARASAKEENIELFEHLANLYFENKDIHKYKLPQPAFNIINGGKHSDNDLCFQEFMILPEKFDKVKEKIEIAKQITSSLKNILLKDGQSIDMGDEGGFAPKISSNEKALEYLEEAIVDAGYDTDKIKIALDIAATSFFKDDKYIIEDKKLNEEEMINMYEDLYTHHKIISIEDAFAEEDFEAFAEINKRLGDKINIVGDDLTVTNVDLIKKAIENKSINTVLIKPNQIGSISETMKAIKLAKENNIKIFMSHRSGETLDTFIADFAVAVGADFIKAGATTKKERLVKYERLIEIENYLANK